ncbi:MAG: DUF4270 domain-containing protein [Prevotellaceae bacterium]|jgi:hypothetical protein|nr:DUF4270 domain-containing protein [Prevotellaceae bacterium]
MRIVKYAGAVSLLTLLALGGCDDNTGSLGMDMLPGADGLSTQTDTFHIHTRSITVDSVFARTSTGYVGQFTDPGGFGRYQASFLTELNCTDDFTLPDVYQYHPETKSGTGSMAGDSAVRAQLTVYYSTWFGDSLNACRMTAYTLNKRVERDHYTNFDPAQYYQTSYGDDTTKFVVHKAYTAYDTTVSDTVRNAVDAYGNKTYYPSVTFPLDKRFGNYILHSVRKHPEWFKNSDAFIDNVFKGVYLKSSYGDGTILYVDRVDLQMQFRFHYVDSVGVALQKKDGTDSLYYSIATLFASTKEILQANRFSNSEEIAQMAAQTEHTYIKAPAGIFTEADIPYERISDELHGDSLNGVRLTFTNYRQETPYNYSMKAPATLLLIRKKDVKKFFEENSLPDMVTSFYADHNAVATNQYVFGNVARLITTCVREKAAAKKAAEEAGAQPWDEAAWNEENKVVLIPVVASYEYNSSGAQTMTTIQNDLTPSYTRLKGGNDQLVIEVTHTSFYQE